MKQKEQRALIEGIQKKIDQQAKETEIDPIDIIAKEMGVSRNRALAIQSENQAIIIGNSISRWMLLGCGCLLIAGFCIWLKGPRILPAMAAVGATASVAMFTIQGVRKENCMDNAKQHMDLDLLEKQRSRVLAKISDDLGVEEEQSIIFRDRVESYILWRFDQEVLAPNTKVILKENGIPTVTNIEAISERAL